MKFCTEKNNSRKCSNSEQFIQVCVVQWRKTCQDLQWHEVTKKTEFLPSQRAIKRSPAKACLAPTQSDWCPPQGNGNPELLSGLSGKDRNDFEGLAYMRPAYVHRITSALGAIEYRHFPRTDKQTWCISSLSRSRLAFRYKIFSHFFDNIFNTIRAIILCSNLNINN